MTVWNSWARAALVTTIAVGGACTDAPGPSSSDAVIYEVTFQGTWTRDSHPTDYPSYGPHFTGIIGASHTAGYAMFKEGTLATDGLSQVARTGGHYPMNDELAAAALGGTVGDTFTTGSISDVSAPRRFHVEVSPRFPLLSFATMVAPSSDWFTGVAGEDLRENGEWVRSRSVQVHAWDSGTYEGATYVGPVQRTAPPQPVALSDAPPFLYGGARPPIATVTFERVY